MGFSHLFRSEEREIKMDKTRYNALRSAILQTLDASAKAGSSLLDFERVQGYKVDLEQFYTTYDTSGEPTHHIHTVSGDAEVELSISHDDIIVSDLKKHVVVTCERDLDDDPERQMLFLELIYNLLGRVRNIAFDGYQYLAYVGPTFFKELNNTDSKNIPVEVVEAANLYAHVWALHGVDFGHGLLIFAHFLQDSLDPNPQTYSTAAQYVLDNYPLFYSRIIETEIKTGMIIRRDYGFAESSVPATLPKREMILAAAKDAISLADQRTLEARNGFKPHITFTQMTKEAVEVFRRHGAPWFPIGDILHKKDWVSIDGLQWHVCPKNGITGAEYKGFVNKIDGKIIINVTGALLPEPAVVTS